ncbi:MAG: DUF2071 domain-containing protein [Bythopirellula sp.]|nr:DUF2071 domain-containing protein [Bythopirellula sp.]
MRIPVVRGIIERRILANYHIDPAVVARVLPLPFRPHLVNGYALGGICLIRLGGIRPRFLPAFCGLRSENAAHRFAVEWDVDGQTRQGVYIPRRDTDSRLTAWGGGTIFPGLHQHAKFTVKETNKHLSVALVSDDGEVRVRVAGTVTDRLPSSSVFADLADASEFFARGSLGYSATQSQGRYEGLELRCQNWQVDPLAIESVESSYFANESLFPRGSVEFDCALLMRGIHHEWHGREDLCCGEQVWRV